MSNQSSTVRRNPYRLMIKVLLSITAILIVSRKVEVDVVSATLLDVHWGFMVSAMLFFILSKTMTALRLNSFFKNIGVNLTHLQNFRLYAIGMFYNLLLPGGIGGDGYKIIILRNKTGASGKQLLHALVFDRLSGLVSIIFLIGIFWLLLRDSFPLSWKDWDLTLIIISFGVLPFFWFVSRFFFQTFLPSIWRGSVLSFAGQVGQLFSAYLILKSIGINDGTGIYLMVFLISSIVTIIPITLGGVGIREMVFVFAQKILDFDVERSIVFSILFFLLTSITSLPGGLFSLRIPQIVNNENTR